MEFAIKQAEFVTSAGLGSPYPEKTAAEIALSLIHISEPTRPY